MSADRLEYPPNVSERVAIETAPREANRNDLETKHEKLGHLLSLAVCSVGDRK